MTPLKTLEEAIALAMTVRNTTPLPELETVADQLLAFRDSTKLNFEDGYQLGGAMTKVGSHILNHADRPRLTEEQLRDAQKSRKRSGTLSF